MIAIVNCLAAGFSELLARELDSAQMQRIIVLNRAAPSAPCASRDVCAADRLMTAAFSTLMQRRPFACSSVDTDLMDRAWVVARRAGFDAALIRESIHQTLPRSTGCPPVSVPALGPLGRDAKRLAAG